MTRADIVGGLLLAAGFGAVLREASSFQYGTEFAPGPGFAPIWYGAVGLVLSLLIVGFGWRANRQPSRPAVVETDRVDRAGLFRVGATLAALVALLFLVPWLGLLPTLLGFLLFLTLAVQRLPALPAIGTSVATVVFIYLVFVRFLGVPVPTGPLGF